MASTPLSPELPRWTVATGWNGWRQFEGRLCFPAHGEIRPYFWIDLADLETEREVLNQLRWIRNSSWADDRVLAGLTRALCDVWSCPPEGDDLDPIRAMRKNWGPEAVDLRNTG
jgi:hypothetical protein